MLNQCFKLPMLVYTRLHDLTFFFLMFCSVHQVRCQYVVTRNNNENKYRIVKSPKTVAEN